MIKTQQFMNANIKSQPDAVEKYFCEPFERLRKREMNQESTEFLFKLLKTDKDKFNPIPDKQKPFVLQVVEKRIEHCFTMKISDMRLRIWICYLAESPGKAIMYLVYLQYCCKSRGIKDPTLEQFCEMLPLGYPSDEDMNALWDQIKVPREEDPRGSDNLLDYQDAYKSIQF